MSASLFYDCYAPYETYPKTEYCIKDKTFGECKEGDTLFLLNRAKDGQYEFQELIITKPLHQARGRFYISTIVNKKKMAIDFGPYSCGNVLDGKNNSIIFYKGIIGTNKQSILDTKTNIIKKELSDLIKQEKFCIYEINKLKNITL